MLRQKRLFVSIISNLVSTRNLRVDLAVDHLVDGAVGLLGDTSVASGLVDTCG